MTYGNFISPDIRLSILLLLLEGGQYSHNEYVIQQGLAFRFGHSLSSDKLRTEVAWLAEQGLVENRDAFVPWIVSMTTRGKDVAEGKTTVPGVKRPEPGM